MSAGFSIRRANVRDMDRVFGMILDRIKWMDGRGIRQWNTDGYLIAFPREYYDGVADSFFVAERDGEIVGAIAIFESDDRWPDGERAAAGSQKSGSTAKKETKRWQNTTPPRDTRSSTNSRNTNTSE